MTVLDAFDLAVCNDAELARRAAAGDAQARRESIERYVPLALRYRWSGEALDDLIQVASLALLKTVDRWHPERGYAFSSYAVPTILGELRRYFRDATRIVRPPRGLIELSLLVESERQKFGAALGREPAVAELAERLDHPHAAVSAAVEAHASRVPRSLVRAPRCACGSSTTSGSGRLQRRSAARSCRSPRIIRTSLERRSAHASMACGGWSMSDATEGATA
jgi:RNA polymerase sigma factor (sigma-70 family)